MKMKLEMREKRMIIEPDVRKLFDMRDVIYDHKWLSSTNDIELIELYYMYRGIYFDDKDIVKMNEYGLRYDITVIPPYMLGCEFVKTAGHYHQIVPGTDITFPEIYEVLDGNAHFLMHRSDRSDGDAIQDVVMIKAEQGDKVIVPPGYGHITINTSDNILKIANWVAADKESLYDPIKRKKGGAYFVLRDRIVKNHTYSHVPELRILKPKDLSKIGIKNNDDMYKLIDDIEKLEFLIRPHEHERLFEDILI